MRLLDPSTTQRQRRSVGIISVPLVVGLLLAGCSSTASEETAATPTSSASATPNATPTPTPTPTREPASTVAIAEAPQTADEAIAAAAVSVQTYLEIRADIEINHPDDASSLDTIAMDEAAADVRARLRNQLEKGLVYSGLYSFDVTGGSAGDLTTSDGTLYPFGAVRLDGCFSSEQISVVNPDGTRADLNPIRRGLYTMSVAYIPAEKHWIVTAESPVPGDIVPC